MFKEECKKFGLPHIVIDANADKNQDLCDKYEVNALPHVQIIRQPSKLVLLEYAGYMHPVSLLSTLKKRLSAQRVKIKAIDPAVGAKPGGCSECKKKKDRETLKGGRQIDGKEKKK